MQEWNNEIHVFFFQAADLCIYFHVSFMRFVGLSSIFHIDNISFIFRIVSLICRFRISKISYCLCEATINHLISKSYCYHMGNMSSSITRWSGGQIENADPKIQIRIMQIRNLEIEHMYLHFVPLSRIFIFSFKQLRNNFHFAKSFSHVYSNMKLKLFWSLFFTTIHLYIFFGHVYFWKNNFCLVYY